MSDDSQDPSGNTQAFQAWVDNGGQQPQPAASKTPVIVAIVIVAVIVLGGLAFLALS